MLRLDKIITADLRLNILRYFFAEKPGAKVSIRQLSRELNYAPSHVKYELEVLESAGVLEKQKIGNQNVFYSIYQGPLINVFKSEPHLLLDKIKDVNGIDLAYAYSIERDRFKILIIGNPDVYFLSRVIRNIEHEGGFNVKYLNIKKEDIQRKNLPTPLFFIIGTQKYFDEIKAMPQTISKHKDKFQDYRKRKRER